MLPMLLQYQNGYSSMHQCCLSHCQKRFTCKGNQNNLHRSIISRGALLLQTYLLPLALALPQNASPHLTTCPQHLPAAHSLHRPKRKGALLAEV